jgi:hypothetical protein
LLLFECLSLLTPKHQWKPKWLFAVLRGLLQLQ